MDRAGDRTADNDFFDTRHFVSSHCLAAFTYRCLAALPPAAERH
jgi:hypothetical protein